MDKYAKLFQPGKPNINHAHPAFRCLYWKQPCVGLYARYMVSDTPNPIANTIKQRWMNRDTDELWWWTVSSPSGVRKSTMRHHQARKLRNAFRDGLKAHGLDWKGNPLEATSSSKRVQPLRGSVQLNAEKGLKDIKFSTLQERCIYVIGHLLAVRDMSAKNPMSQRQTTKPTPRNLFAPEKSVRQDLRKGPVRTKNHPLPLIGLHTLDPLRNP